MVMSILTKKVFYTLQNEILYSVLSVLIALG